MDPYLIIGGMLIVGLAVIIFLSRRSGKVEVNKDIAVKIAKERAKDAEIASEPFVSGPFSKLRRKK